MINYFTPVLIPQAQVSAFPDLALNSTYNYRSGERPAKGKVICHYILFRKFLSFSRD